MDIRELCTLYSNAPVADFLSSAWKKGQVCEADNWQGSSVAVAFSSRLPRKGEMRLFVMNDEDGVLTKSDDGRYIAWYPIFFDELVDRDWIEYDIRLEKQRCALDTKYFYETYYKLVKIDKNIH